MSMSVKQTDKTKNVSSINSSSSPETTIEVLPDDGDNDDSVIEIGKKPFTITAEKLTLVCLRKPLEW